MNKSTRFCLLMGLLAFTSNAEASVCGQLAAVKGKSVEVLRIQANKLGEVVRYALRAQEGKVLPLECDDIVLTGADSSAKIVLANGKLTLGPETRIEMMTQSGATTTAPQVSLLNLSYGKLRALIHKAPTAAAASEQSGEGQAQKQNKKPNDQQNVGQSGAGGDGEKVRFRVRTFSAVAGVRGTDFYTGYDPTTGLTEQATLEGSVEVQQSGSAQKVLVGSGQQVQVETIAAAVAEATERLKSGTDRTALEIPKQAPDLGNVKPLKVGAIQDSLRQDIRVASAVAKDDQDFTSKKAIEALGRPETWTLEREAVPEKLKGIKNEF